MAVKNDIRRFARDLRGVIKNVTSRKELLRAGNLSIELIKERTRKGFGVDRPGANKERLDRLSPEYIEQRKRMKLSPFTNARKSNLTRSGRMLASMRSTVVDDKVVVRFTGRSREGELNSKIAEYVTDQGRPFFNLSDKEAAKVIGQLEKVLVRGIKQLD